MNKLRRCACVVSVMMLALAGPLMVRAYAQGSAVGEQIPWWVIGSGGVVGSSSGNVRMSATVGQPVIGTTAEPGGTILYQGFWYPRQVASSVELEPGDAVAGMGSLRNYPNPFTQSTTIHYMLPGRGEVRLAIYDMRGDLVRTLVDGVQESGAQEVVWDGRTDRGEEAASASYLCVVEASLATGNTTRHFTQRQILQRLR